MPGEDPRAGRWKNFTKTECGLHKARNVDAGMYRKIGKGPRAAKDLTWDEAKRVMKALIEGEVTPVQVGAFLMAMRIKMESVTNWPR